LKERADLQKTDNSSKVITDNNQSKSQFDFPKVVHGFDCRWSGEQIFNSLKNFDPYTESIYYCCDKKE
jgi:hypothetical protein